MFTECLVGSSGLIGQTLLRWHPFAQVYRSTNLEDIRCREVDLLVCAAPSAAKWLANQDPAGDLATVERLSECLSTVRAGSVVLISTVDVYPVIRHVNEDFYAWDLPNHAYGRNRWLLESRLRQAFPSMLVVRLPAVFGHGLKKNVLFDLLNNNAVDRVNPVSRYQFYGLEGLWNDIQRARHAGLRTVNLVTEPVSTSAIVDRFFPGKRVGGNAVAEAHYDIQTLHAATYGVSGAYRHPAVEVLDCMGRFIASYGTAR